MPKSKRASRSVSRKPNFAGGSRIDRPAKLNAQNICLRTAPGDFGGTTRKSNSKKNVWGMCARGYRVVSNSSGLREGDLRGTLVWRVSEWICQMRQTSGKWGSSYTRGLRIRQVSFRPLSFLKKVVELNPLRQNNGTSNDVRPCTTGETIHTTTSGRVFGRGDNIMETADAQLMAIVFILAGDTMRQR